MFKENYCVNHVILLTGVGDDWKVCCYLLIYTVVRKGH